MSTPEQKPRRPRRSNNNVPGGRRGRGPRNQVQQGFEPVRLQKALADSGYGSRRELEEWIIAGRVSVNGLPAGIGQKVGPGDRVKINGRLVNVKFTDRAPRVMIYHKPEGEIVSRDDPEGRVSVFDRLPMLRKGRWIAVGRLDFNTSGLLVFTNNGDLANRLMHPRYELEREYAVRLLGELTEEQIESLKQGVMLEDGEARFNSLSDGGGEGSNHWYHVTISEGRNREVRRMFEAVGLTVSRLMRVRYGPIQLPRALKRGAWSEMNEAEVRALTAALPEDLPGAYDEPLGATDDHEEFLQAEADAEDAEAWAKANSMVLPVAKPARESNGRPGFPRERKARRPGGEGYGNGGSNGNGNGGGSGNGNGGNAGGANGQRRKRPAKPAGKPAAANGPAQDAKPRNENGEAPKGRRRNRGGKGRPQQDSAGASGAASAVAAGGQGGEGKADAAPRNGGARRRRPRKPAAPAAE